MNHIKKTLSCILATLFVFQNVHAQETVAITFSVDMNQFEETFTTVYLSGTFNDWSANANPLTDADQDGVWETTISDVAVGEYRYKFQLDEWSHQETFNGYETCTVVSDPIKNFVDRTLEANEDTVLPTICFGSCYACGESVRITVRLGQGLTTPSPDGFYISGGGPATDTLGFGIPGDFKLIDDDGDGIHTAVFERAKGFKSLYRFANGNCPNFSCLEAIGGQSCSNPDFYDDRLLDPVTQDTTISTCYELCTESAEECSQSAKVVFGVDMSEYEGTYNQVFVSGFFNNWSSLEMNEEGNSIYSKTVQMPLGYYQYKFQLDFWAAQEIFTGEEPCSTDPGQYVDRFITINKDTTICFKWNSCEALECGIVDVEDIETAISIFKARPTLVQHQTQLDFNPLVNGEKEVVVFDATGKLLMSVTLPSITERYTLSMDDYTNGLYFIQVKSDASHQTQKVLKF